MRKTTSPRTLGASTVDYVEIIHVRLDEKLLCTKIDVIVPREQCGDCVGLPISLKMRTAFRLFHSTRCYWSAHLSEPTDRTPRPI